VIGGDLVVAVGADDEQRSGIGIRENRVQQFERCSIGPLQVVEKDDEWMPGPSKGPDEAAEHVAKSVLRFDGLQRNRRRLFADDEFDLRNDGRNDTTIGAKSLGKGRAPAGEAFLVLRKHLPDEAPKRLDQRAVRDVAGYLVELAADEIAPVTNDRSEQFVDERRLPDARVATDQQERGSTFEGLFEGARQLREWEQLQDEIPSLDMALKFTDRPLKNVSLSVEEWRVVSYINPKNTMKQIAQTNKMNDLEIRRIVYGLLQAGLVEIVRPEGMVIPMSPKTFPTQNKEEQKSLVNRLIGRIRSL